MGAALTANQINSTYNTLLKLTDNGILSPVLKTVTDGFGNESALRLSTTNVSVLKLNITTPVNQGASSGYYFATIDPVTFEVKYRTFAEVGLDLGVTPSILDQDASLQSAKFRISGNATMATGAAFYTRIGTDAEILANYKVEIKGDAARVSGVHIQGGSAATGNALLLRNSAGTNLLEVKNAGRVLFGNPTDDNTTGVQIGNGFKVVSGVNNVISTSGQTVIFGSNGSSVLRSVGAAQIQAASGVTIPLVIQSQGGANTIFSFDIANAYFNFGSVRLFGGAEESVFGKAGGFGSHFVTSIAIHGSTDSNTSGFRFKNGQTVNGGSVAHEISYNAGGNKDLQFINAGSESMRLAYATRNVLVGITADNTTDKLQLSGSLGLVTAGNKLRIKSGANSAVGTVTLVAGTATVSTTAITANSHIILVRKTSGGTPGGVITYTITAGTSFTVTSDNAADTSTFTYQIYDAI